MLSWALQWQGGLVKGSSPASTDDVSVLYDLRSDWLDLQAKCSCSKHVINHILSRTPSQPASKQSMLPISPGTSPLHTTWLNPLWRANSWRGYAPLINPNVYFLLIPSLLTELFFSRRSLFTAMSWTATLKSLTQTSFQRILMEKPPCLTARPSPPSFLALRTPPSEGTEPRVLPSTLLFCVQILK